MFSATWPREVRNLALDFQKNAVHLNVNKIISKKLANKSVFYFNWRSDHSIWQQITTSCKMLRLSKIIWSIISRERKITKIRIFATLSFRPQRLSDLLNEISDSKTLVFVATKRKADELCREMRLRFFMQIKRKFRICWDQNMENENDAKLINLNINR